MFGCAKMDIKEVSENYNQIFNRKELDFIIDNVSQGSPKIYDVRKSIAEKYNASEEAVYIIKLNTATGTNRTYGKLEIYDSSEEAKKIVPKYIQKRNSSARRSKEAKTQTKAPKKVQTKKT